MKRKRFSLEQIAAVLQQGTSGVPVGNVCRQVGISEQTFYRWRKTYGAMQPSEAREVKQLRDENTKPKRSSRTRPWTRSCCRIALKTVLKPVRQCEVTPT